ncbi:MAG: alanine racemase [bacterium]|nr:alanine racemase [bacterium]
MRKNNLRTWVEVDTKALEKNYRIFRRLTGRKTALMAVAKSNAYGHSLHDFARVMQKFGVDWIGADSITEAIALREAKIKKPLLVLGHTLPLRYKEAAENNISVTVSTHEALDAIVKKTFSKPLKIHLKIDTGMSRQGFFVEDLPEVFAELSHKKDKIKFEGIYTHFAAAKNPSFPFDTHKQLEVFDRALKAAEFAGFKNLIRHAAATSGLIVFPESKFDMARVGIGMYGLWPSREVEAAFSDRIKLQPALTWKAIIGETKTLTKGSGVGYDFTEKVQNDMRVAIIPIGYWHGYPRKLSSIGRVIIKGGVARVVGRVSMDMIVVDISGVPSTKVGDEVILLGKGFSADDFALLSDTINYEAVTQINPLIHRFYN